MFPPPKKSKISLILCSPTLAVIAAYLLRMFLLWLSQHKDGMEPTLRLWGLEEVLVAVSLAHGKGFFGPFPGYEAPTAWLAPGYPLLWAICIRLTRLPVWGYVWLAQVLNSAFSAATCWPIFSIAKKVFGEKVGLASTWVWVFLPYSILMSLEWTWDQCVAAFLFAVIVDATLRLRESSSPLRWSGYGLLWAAGAFVNPAMCALLPFLLGWLVFQRWRAGVVSPALYARPVLLFFLAVLPWSIRNYYTLGGWVFVKSNFGDTLYVGNHPDSPPMDPHPMNNINERRLLIFQGEPQFNEIQQRLAIQFIESHPVEFLKKTGDRILDIWSAKYDSAADRWMVVLHLQREDVWLCSLFSVLGLAGLILSLQRYGTEALPLAMCVLVFPLPYYITVSQMRYRHPMDPFLTILAVYAVFRLWTLRGAAPSPEPIENLQASAAT